MSKVDTELLRQLYSHLGIEPYYRISSYVSYQLQERNPAEQLPAPLALSINELRDLAVTSRDYQQIGATEFDLGLDFLDGSRNSEAVAYFKAAQRQWLFTDLLSLNALAFLGAGMANQGAGDYREAAAAYFRVTQCLKQLEAEPYRMDEFKPERNLEDFWTDLKRLLGLKLDALQSEFSKKQEEILRAALGDLPGKEAAGSEGGDGLTTLTLEMQSTSSMSVDDIDTLIFETIDGVELLSLTLTPDGAHQVKLRVRRLTVNNRDPITIELDNVAKHAVNLIRWMVNSIALEEPTPANLADDQGGKETWFRWQAKSGTMAEVIKTFVQSAVDKVLDEAQVNQVIEALGHLAELRLNCRLIVA